MVVDNCGNIDIQFVVVGFYQQIVQIVCFFCYQNYYLVMVCWIQFVDGVFRQGVVEIGQQSSVVKNVFQFGVYKEMIGMVVNKFIVLYNVEFMFVVDIGDMCDEVFLIRVNSVQYFML